MFEFADCFLSLNSKLMLRSIRLRPRFIDCWVPVGAPHLGTPTSSESKIEYTLLDLHIASLTLYHLDNKHRSPLHDDW